MSQPSTELHGRHVVLGVSGSIAAYKACALASLLVKAGAEVHPVLTRGGARFITPESLTALCGRPTLMDEFDRIDPREMTHITLAQQADIVVLAPASANLIARIAAGMANDMLTLLLTVTRAPVVMAPAMNTSMWTHPLVSRNIAALLRIGYSIVEPEEGRLACGTEGTGKLAEPETVVRALEERLGRERRESQTTSLSGRRFLVTAGPTREPLDSVRYIGNRSSGKMGYAIAEAAVRRGAIVTLVSGPTALPAPAGVEMIAVETAAQMCDAVLSHLENAEVVIAAAAVADFTAGPVGRPGEKIRRSAGPLTLKLTPTVDIAEEVGKRKGSRVHVGFAAEVGDPAPAAARKMAVKNLDLVVANDITEPGAGFDVDTNVVTFVYPGGRTERLPLLSKREVSERILDRVEEQLTAAPLRQN
ncbi:MAG: bifunctional phosphopantothenoylcysteine decarboxylase/phosphopantothenate--cysteine ligase CoaBC [Chloroflexi bacterium]|nr:bifunctional phosphopantothenoylcysteine decarboxylase/phosphopantothenate--cysteine ligase CoaBC [Chloroflexota bacterium]